VLARADASEAAEPSCETAPNRAADDDGGWYSRPHEDPALLRKNRHNVLARHELELSPTASESRRAHEDRHSSGDANRAVVPLDTEAS